MCSEWIVLNIKNNNKTITKPQNSNSEQTWAKRAQYGNKGDFYLFLLLYLPIQTQHQILKLKFLLFQDVESV